MAKSIKCISSWILESVSGNYAPYRSDLRNYIFYARNKGAGILRGLLIFYGGFIITVLAIAQFAQLENIRWLVENLLAIAIIAVIVVFQPEIRRGLIRIGENSGMEFLM